MLQNLKGVKKVHSAIHQGFESLHNKFLLNVFSIHRWSLLILYNVYNHFIFTLNEFTMLYFLSLRCFRRPETFIIFEIYVAYTTCEYMSQSVK